MVLYKNIKKIKYGGPLKKYGGPHKIKIWWTRGDSTECDRLMNLKLGQVEIVFFFFCLFNLRFKFFCLTKKLNRVWGEGEEEPNTLDLSNSSKVFNFQSKPSKIMLWISSISLTMPPRPSFHKLILPSSLQTRQLVTFFSFYSLLFFELGFCFMFFIGFYWCYDCCKKRVFRVLINFLGFVAV